MTSPSPLSIGGPWSLGDPSVLHTARMDRLALGVNYRPSATALGAVSGIVHGPTGSVGALTLVSDTVLRVDPFVAVIQGTHNTRQGQYTVPNEQQRDLAIVAKDASLTRRSLIVVRVADSDEAGVAPSATTNGAWIERLDGTAVASNAALPTLPANTLALGELTIPSVASGQPVQLTPYNPRTGARHGILPVFADTSTVPGHGSAPGTFIGEYRDHPTLGLQRWDGSAWQTIPSGDTGRINVTPTAPITVGPGGMYYRRVGKTVEVNVDSSYSGAYSANFVLFTLPAGFRPETNRFYMATPYGYNGAGGPSIMVGANGAVSVANTSSISYGGVLVSGTYLVP